MSDEATKKRIPVKRWLVLGLVALGIYCAFIGPSILKPISPVVVLPGEEVWPGLEILPGLPLTNTTLATLITDAILLLMAAGAWLFVRSGKMVPEGFYNFFEFLVEFLWNSVEGAAGKWARRIFPVVATIFFLVFVANMVKMVPGFESIGRMKQVHEGIQGYAPVQLTQIGGLKIFTIDKGQPQDAPAHAEEGDHSAEGEDASHAAETESHGAVESHGKAEGICTEACEVVPWLRGSATDLNFPFALAFIAVFMTQVYGVWALGPGYFEKFFPIRQLISGGPFGAINFGVGLLEIVLELAKILSFGFRLFGNIFAGALLLSIVGALTAVIVPAGLYLFEVFFGIIQAYVFFLLGTMFMSGATVSHHGDDHGEGHGEQAAAAAH